MTDPKNREADALPFLEIRVDHAGGSEKTDPNGAVGCVIWGAKGLRPRTASGADLPGLFNPLELEPIDGIVSVISGQPAVVYRADDLTISMTPKELLRFLARDLRPDEFFALRERYGDFFEIHDDFYDPQSGQALQPVFQIEDDAPRASRTH